MSKQKIQTLSEYLDEFARAETKRIKEAQENFSTWLASQDKSEWVERTQDSWKRIWSPND